MQLYTLYIYIHTGIYKEPNTINKVKRGSGATLRTTVEEYLNKSLGDRQFTHDGSHGGADE